MRTQLSRLRRSTSTKSERRISEILKRNRIKFQFRARVGKYEADFLIGRVVIEVDGNVHKRSNSIRDAALVKMGYIPIHVHSDIEDSQAVEQELNYLISKNNGRSKNSRKNDPANIVPLDRTSKV